MTRQARCEFWQHVERALSEMADDIRRVNVPVDERMSGKAKCVCGCQPSCDDSPAVAADLSAEDLSRLLQEGSFGALGHRGEDSLRFSKCGGSRCSAARCCGQGEGRTWGPVHNVGSSEEQSNESVLPAVLLPPVALPSPHIVAREESGGSSLPPSRRLGDLSLLAQTPLQGLTARHNDSEQARRRTRLGRCAAFSLNPASLRPSQMPRADSLFVPQ